MVGTKDHPLRISSTNHLQCLLRFWLMQMKNKGKETGESESAYAIAGTLLHYGVEEWLKGIDIETVKARIKERKEFFRSKGLPSPPSIPEIYRWLDKYCSDPRNAPENVWPKKTEYGKVVASEMRVACEIPPAEFDPTGKPVYFIGTLDQIRVTKQGYVYAWDIKTGARTAGVYDAVTQICLYAKGAEQALGEKVALGGIIAMRNDDIFQPTPLPYDAIPSILDFVAEQVALARLGYFTPQIAGHCSSCLAANGPGACLPKMPALLEYMETEVF